MVGKLYKVSFLFILYMCLFACKTQDNKADIPTNTAFKDNDTVRKVDEKVTNQTRAIFYNMYPPVEMATLFEKVGAVYDPSILNATENAENYITSSERALNLGIYGVDLSYARNFEEYQAALEYLSVIHKISTSLGIPEEYFTAAADYIDEEDNNKDTLNAIASKIYYSTDEYLKKNAQENTAALIMLGGWIEALYIAINIAYDDVDNNEITERIAVQKYSLNSLISLLSNNRDDVTVAKYLLMLKVLKKSFDDIEVHFGEDVNVDTVNKVISANTLRVEYTPDVLTEIREIVNSIRSEIIN